jgi:hypothetical protein
VDQSATVAPDEGIARRRPMNAGSVGRMRVLVGLQTDAAIGARHVVDVARAPNTSLALRHTSRRARRCQAVEITASRAVDYLSESLPSGAVRMSIVRSDNA